MKKMSIQEFVSESNIEIIQGLMNANNGYITTKVITELGIHRMYLNIMKNKGLIESVGNGVYLDSTKIKDDYFILNLETQNMIYSHMTALYFHQLSIKAPDRKYDISIPNNYHNEKLKQHNIFYIPKKWYTLGLTEVETPHGNKVRVYDIERCICDIIRSKNRMDIEHIKYSVKEYLKRKDKDLVKLSIYADKMKIKEEVMNLISMIYE